MRPSPTLTVVSVIRDRPIAVDLHFATVQSELARARDARFSVDHVVRDGVHAGDIPRVINAAMRSSEGRFVCVLLDSDCPEQGALRWVCDQIEHTGREAVSIVGDCRLADIHGTTTWRPAPMDRISAEVIAQPLSHWLAGRCLVGPEVVFRRARALSLGGFDAHRPIAFDYSLWLRMLMAGGSFLKHTRAFVYRVESDDRAGPAIGDSLRDVARAGLSILLAESGRDSHEPWRAVAVREHEAIGIRSQAIDVIEARMRRIESGVCAHRHNDASVRFARTFFGQRSMEIGRRAQMLPHLPDVARYVRRAMRESRIVCPRVAVACDRSRHTPSLVGKWLPNVACVEVIEDRDMPREFDCVVLDGSLMSASDPRATLSRAWAGVSPGGCLVVLGEPGPWADLEVYLHRLRGRMRERLLWTSGVFLDVDADERLSEMFSTPASADFDADRDALLWQEALPGWRGCDMFALMHEIAPRSDVRLVRRYGSVWNHPVMPLPWIAALHVDQSNLWQIGVWQHTG